MRITENRSSEARWPAEGDQLFQAERGESESALVKAVPELWYRLPQGFKRAGDVIASRALSDGVGGRELLHPALFCYRHAIELYLKRLIEEFGTLEKRAHELEGLWCQFEALVLSEFEEIEGLAEVRSLVLELHEVDSTSQRFRYPTDKKGNSFSGRSPWFSLPNWVDLMQGIQNFFECTRLELLERRIIDRPDDPD